MTFLRHRARMFYHSKISSCNTGSESLSVGERLDVLIETLIARMNCMKIQEINDDARDIMFKEFLKTQIAVMISQNGMMDIRIVQRIPQVTKNPLPITILIHCHFQ